MSVQKMSHWGWDKMSGWDKMDAISQTTFSSAFSWMKIFEFRLKIHWRLFLRVQLTIFQDFFLSLLLLQYSRISSGNGLATSHYLNQWWLFYQCIYASLDLNDFSPNPFYCYLHLQVRFHLGWGEEEEEEEEVAEQKLCHPLCQCTKCRPLQKVSVL